MFPPFLKRGPNSTIDDYVEAIAYVLSICGEENVGIGTDFTRGYGRPFFDWITHDKGYGRNRRSSAKLSIRRVCAASVSGRIHCRNGTAWLALEPN